MRRRHVKLAAILATALSAAPAFAGPPFLTDDPEPTDTGHWEIYGPLIEAAGKGSDFEGVVALEINYGAAPDLQVTLSLPVAYVHNRDGFQSGAGDVELSVKYRFYRDDAAQLSIAIFPGLTFPTASKGMGNSKVTGLLPVWIQKDAGPWSVFGGGGYAINPGRDNRDYWTAGVAVTRAVDDRLLIGIEADRQGSDSIGSRAATSIGLGAIYQLGDGPFRLLVSGGPTFEDGNDATGFHAFLALGESF
jgi:hypothetical protein